MGPLHHWGISLLLRWHCASPMPGRKWESPKQRGGWCGGATGLTTEGGEPTLHCGSERASEIKKKRHYSIMRTNGALVTHLHGCYYPLLPAPSAGRKRRYLRYLLARPTVFGKCDICSRGSFDAPIGIGSFDANHSVMNIISEDYDGGSECR